MMLAALCHDFGKPNTTRPIEGRITSYGHEKAGLHPTRLFLHRMTDDKALIGNILPFVEHHLKPANLYKSHLHNKVSDSAIRRLALKIRIKDLVFFCKSDHYGRGNMDASEPFEAGEWLLKRAQSLRVSTQKPVPLLKGRHLVAMGMMPGPKIGLLLKEAFELQIQGKLKTLDACLNWAQKKC